MARLFTTFLLSAGLLSFGLLSFGLLNGAGALACEKHLNGHQNGSDTNAEGFQK